MDAGTATDGVRVWFVERDGDDADGAVEVTYATTGGERCLEVERERAAELADVDGTPAALTAAAEELTAVEEAETRERYAAAARRVARSHHPEHVV